MVNINLITLLSFGVVFGRTGQQILLPLWLSTFEGANTGPYFILLFAGYMFNLIFWLMCAPLFYHGKITEQEQQWKWHPYLAMIGICDALNGFGIVYNSDVTRISGPLQNILLQSTIIFTVIFTKIILKRSPTITEFFGILVILGGIVIALMPTWLSISSGQDTVSASEWYYPIFFILGCIPSALMNIFMEIMQEKFTTETGNKFSVIYLQAIESFYQLLFFIIFFWLDFIPVFGTSSSMLEWSQIFESSFECFVNYTNLNSSDSRCQYNAIFGMIFIASYALTYLFSTLMTQHSSASMLAMIFTLPTILANIFWYIIPGINSWAGGNELGINDFMWDSIATIIIVVGIIIYKNDKKIKRCCKDKTKRNNDIEII